MSGHAFCVRLSPVLDSRLSGVFTSPDFTSYLNFRSLSLQISFRQIKVCSDHGVVPNSGDETMLMDNIVDCMMLQDCC